LASDRREIHFGGGPAHHHDLALPRDEHGKPAEGCVREDLRSAGPSSLRQKRGNAQRVPACPTHGRILAQRRAYACPRGGSHVPIDARWPTAYGSAMSSRQLRDRRLRSVQWTARLPNARVGSPAALSTTSLRLGAPYWTGAP